MRLSFNDGLLRLERFLLTGRGLLKCSNQKFLWRLRFRKPRRPGRRLVHSRKQKVSGVFLILKLIKNLRVLFIEKREWKKTQISTHRVVRFIELNSV